jgi:phosphoribosylaminoimidazole-succinocarboxamide synthase
LKKPDIPKHLDYTLEQTDFKPLGRLQRGKVRDVYTQNDRLLIISTDRYTAFDRRLALIPFKGWANTQITKYWFEQTKDIVQNHVINFPDPNVLAAKKLKVQPVEVVVRGFITGVTSTALWTHYQNGQREFDGFTLPNGMKKNQRLDRPVITPTTKFEPHDRPVSRDEITSKMVKPELWDEICRVAGLLFKRGQEKAFEKGLLLVDTKYEFGTDAKGELYLIDEIHTPDSSRYWKADSYEARVSAGEEPEYFDKEFLRLWFRNRVDPYDDQAVMPEAPKSLVAELSRRYVTIYEQLTGNTFAFDPAQPIAERIAHNLKEYEI